MKILLWFIVLILVGQVSASLKRIDDLEQQIKNYDSNFIIQIPDPLDNSKTTEQYIDMQNIWDELQQLKDSNESSI